MDLMVQRLERSMIRGRFLSGCRSVSILHPNNVTTGCIRETIYQCLNAACSQCCIQKHEDQYRLRFNILRHNVLTVIFCVSDVMTTDYHVRVFTVSVFSAFFCCMLRALHFIINTSYYKSSKAFEDNKKYLNKTCTFLKKPKNV